MARSCELPFDKLRANGWFIAPFVVSLSNHASAFHLLEQSRLAGVWTGHMVDGCSETWWTHLSMLGIVPEVKLGDLMSGEEDVPDSIVSCRPNSHWHCP